MTRPQRFAAIAVGVIVAFGLLLGQLSGTGSGGERPTLGSPDDPGPDGLLALAVLLDSTAHEVERIAEAPSDGGLDPEKTTFLVSPGSLTTADANALREVAEEGGRVVLVGDPGDAALSRLLDSGTTIGDGPANGASPLVPSPETAGIESVGGVEWGNISGLGASLPLLGALGEPTVALARAGPGSVIVVADDALFQNAQITTADNARFAINLAGEEGREVQLVEAVRTAPGSGLSALPAAWGWAALGLLVAALTLAWARGRRLGPVELASRPLPPPRREYVDAVAGALLRTRDPHAAITPLRDAARDRLARRAGLPHDASDKQIREAAQAAGLEPHEVEAVGGQVGEGAMLAAAGALAKLSKRT